MEVGTRLQARSSMSDDFRTGKITEVHDYGACELSFRPPSAASPSASRGAADDRFCLPAAPPPTHLPRPPRRARARRHGRLRRRAHQRHRAQRREAADDPGARDGAAGRQRGHDDPRRDPRRAHDPGGDPPRPRAGQRVQRRGARARPGRAGRTPEPRGEQLRGPRRDGDDPGLLALERPLVQRRVRQWRRAIARPSSGGPRRGRARAREQAQGRAPRLPTPRRQGGAHARVRRVHGALRGRALPHDRALAGRLLEARVLGARHRLRPHEQEGRHVQGLRARQPPHRARLPLQDLQDVRVQLREERARELDQSELRLGRLGRDHRFLVPVQI